MKPEDIFAGPILRRVEPGLVTIWIALKKYYDLDAAVRVANSDIWLGESYDRHVTEVFPGRLFVYVLAVTPTDGTEFPRDRMLEYLLFHPDDDIYEPGRDLKSFPEIVKLDGLTYPGFSLPSFFIPEKGRRLTALYCSCRKVHDLKAGSDDALAQADGWVQKHVSMRERPAMLCMAGDQIYADDVHDEVFDELTRIALELSPTQPTEKVGKGNIRLPGKRQRADFVHKQAGFTSHEADNHLVTFAEYVAMYGLAWNRRNWTSRGYSREVQGFVEGLPAVRRLLANTPTYMMFDDHDVTDDWNIDLFWTEDVWAHVAGRRIVRNALHAFWLFQAFGNDPFNQWPAASVIDHLDKKGRHDWSSENELDTFFWKTPPVWEFVTPTTPFLYFLDTRTERGTYLGTPTGYGGAPAFLKSNASWRRTLARLNPLVAEQQGRPVVFVSAAPVFGFRMIEWVQKYAVMIAKAVNPLLGQKVARFVDYESWGGNPRHLVRFLTICGNSDIVVLGGDVHYAFTSTASCKTFDDHFHREQRRAMSDVRFPVAVSGSEPTFKHLYTSRFLQLNSSAAKNSSSSAIHDVVTAERGNSFFITRDGKVHEGHMAGDLLQIVDNKLPGSSTRYRATTLQELQPAFAIRQQHSEPPNTRFLSDHNVGIVRFEGTTVEHSLLTRGGEVDHARFNFRNRLIWEQ